mmetsp:Transcript_17759/g.20095  ORF Transcript_17759/g.20095 Transcript_17759/m.20095 type:complete len:104 (+) Transcript_17759:1178-1489(+)
MCLIWAKTGKQNVNTYVTSFYISICHRDRHILLKIGAETTLPFGDRYSDSKPRGLSMSSLATSRAMTSPAPSQIFHPLDPGPQFTNKFENSSTLPSNTMPSDT